MLDFVFQSDPFELRELASSVRRFAEQSLAPGPFRREDFTQMAKLGLTGMSIDESLGGTKLGPNGVAAVTYEVARAQLGPAIYLSVHAMVSSLLERYQRDRSQGETIQKLASGEYLGAYCLTEATAGSDAGSLRTRAEKQGNSYVLSGEKLYITSGGVADLYIVFARLGNDPTEGISAFVVHRLNPGISFGKPEKKMGCEGAPITSVSLEQCTVSADALLGEEGGGYRIALSGLNGGRVNIAAAACGISAKAIELARKHLRERKQFGQALADFQGLQFMIADMVMQLNASILLTRHAADELAGGSIERVHASTAKCFATDAAMRISTDAVQLFGGAGYIADYGVEQLMRDAKMLQIVEGTNQIQRLLVARSVLGN